MTASWTISKHVKVRRNSPCEALPIYRQQAAWTAGILSNRVSAVCREKFFARRKLVMNHDQKSHTTHIKNNRTKLLITFHHVSSGSVKEQKSEYESDIFEQANYFQQQLAA